MSVAGYLASPRNRPPLSSFLWKPFLLVDINIVKVFPQLYHFIIIEESYSQTFLHLPQNNEKNLPFLLMLK